MSKIFKVGDRVKRVKGWATYPAATCLIKNGKDYIYRVTEVQMGRTTGYQKSIKLDLPNGEGHKWIFTPDHFERAIGVIPTNTILL